MRERDVKPSILVEYAWRAEEKGNNEPFIKKRPTGGERKKGKL